MERIHLAEFCDFVGGDLHHITPRHPASPPIYRKELPTLLDENGNESDESRRRKAERRKKEDEWEFGREAGWNNTRPWVCDVKEYGATLVSSFHWVRAQSHFASCENADGRGRQGLEDMEEAFESEDFYHGPCA